MAEQFDFEAFLDREDQIRTMPVDARVPREVASGLQLVTDLDLWSSARRFVQRLLNQEGIALGEPGEHRLSSALFVETCPALANGLRMLTDAQLKYVREEHLPRPRENQPVTSLVNNTRIMWGRWMGRV